METMVEQKQINYFVDTNKKLPEKFDDDITITEGLNEEEILELEEIIATGFLNWEKKEYDLFVNAVEKYGRFNYEKIMEDIGTKKIEEIKKKHRPTQ